MQEIYVSTDIETDGPIPMENSMLSFGSAAFLKDGTMIGTHTANLLRFPGSRENHETMKWWATQPEAWAACHTNLIKPKLAMKNYLVWLKELPGTPVFVGYPAGFDFLFIYWYLIYYTGESPFSFSALDMKSYAMAKMGTDFKGTAKRNMPKEWFTSQTKHDHIALNDAINQGHLFISMLNS